MIAETEQKKEEVCTGKSDGGKFIVYVVYLCQILGLVFIGVILAWFNRGQDRKTLRNSHFTWQIKTFWIGVCMGGFLLLFIAAADKNSFFTYIVGLIWIGGVIFMIYRILKGFVLLYKGKPIKNTIL